MILKKLFPFFLVSVVLSSQPFAAETVPAPTQDYMKVLLALVFIIGLIFACAWVIRRMSGGVGFNQKHMQVLSVLPLGTREKLMIIRAADEYLLLGVTANGIQTLHRFEEPVDLQHADMNASPFADKLKSLLKGFDGDPLAKHRSTSQGSEKQ